MLADMGERSQVQLVLGRAYTRSTDAVVRTCPRGLLRRGDPALTAAGKAVTESLRLLGRHTPLAPGECVATFAGDLAARWLLHVRVPEWTAREDLSPLLAQCYRALLVTVEETASTTVALPLLGSTLPFWPLGRAVETGVRSLLTWPPTLRPTLVVSSVEALERVEAALDRQ